MTPFEYVIVLISIILGMGMTQIVSGVADLVHQWEKSKLYWPLLLWVIIVFILHIQEWWITYQLRSSASFTLPEFLFILLYPIVLFVLARMLFPIISAGEEYDLDAYYHKNYRKIFFLAAILPFVALLNNITILHLSLLSQSGHVLIISIFVVLITRKKIPGYIHKSLAALLLAAMLLVIGFMWNDRIQ